jgi:hypothetical protein
LHISYRDFPAEIQPTGCNPELQSWVFSLIAKISNLEKIERFEYTEKSVSGMASFQTSVSVKQPGHSGRAPALPLFFRKPR